MNRAASKPNRQAQQGITTIDRFAQQNNRITFILEPLGRDVLGFSIKPTMATVGVGSIGAIRALIIQADVAARDRSVERAAASARPAHCFA